MLGTLVERAVRVDVDVLGRGAVRVRPDEDLAPGQYAVVVRPVSRDRMAGFDVLSDRREGALFGVVRIFGVGEP